MPKFNIDNYELVEDRLKKFWKDNKGAKINSIKTKNSIKDCDLVITGEGKLDSQTQYGKVISGVSNLAKKFNKKIIAVCGDADKDNYNILGFDSALYNWLIYCSP